jgi:hypothetical protein
LQADCPEILVGIFEEVDVTGHHYGFSPYCEDYLDAIRKFDAQVCKRPNRSRISAVVALVGAPCYC